MADLKIFIADDHQIVRDGLRSLIQTNVSGAEVVGEAADGRQAVRDVRRLKPDIVLMDISMPVLNGVEAVRQLTFDLPDCHVIALSMHRSSEYVARMLGAGAKGYLHKDSAFKELESALHAVMAGHVYLDNAIVETIGDDYQRSKALSSPGSDEQLSTREREVLQLVAEGRRTKEIAGILSVSVKTVETHRSQIQRKLRLSGVAQVTRYAIQHGIVSLDA